MLKWIVFSQLSLCLEAHTVKQNTEKQIQFLQDVLLAWLDRQNKEQKKKKENNKGCFDQNSSGLMKQCSTADPNPKMQKFCNTLHWLGETDRERNENSHFHQHSSRRTK